MAVVELHDPYERIYVVQQRSIPARVHNSVTMGCRWRTEPAVDKYILPWYIVVTSIDMRRTRPVGMQRHVERGHLHLASPKIAAFHHTLNHNRVGNIVSHPDRASSFNFGGSFHSIDSPLYPRNNSSFLLAPCIDTVDCHSFLF